MKYLFHHIYKQMNQRKYVCSLTFSCPNTPLMFKNIQMFITKMYLFLIIVILQNFISYKKLNSIGLINTFLLIFFNNYAINNVVYFGPNNSLLFITSFKGSTRAASEYFLGGIPKYNTSLELFLFS